MKTKTGVIFLFAILLLAIAFLFILNISVGSADISIKKFLLSIFTAEGDKTTSFIISEIRLPRAITAVIVGAGLSVAGLLLQTLFHNPMAGPYVLGISSGAGLGVAIYIMAFTAISTLSPEIIFGGQVVSAVLGAFGVFALVLAFSFRVKDTVSLLIIGIMIGSLATALIGVMQFFSTPENVHRFVIWTLGSLSATGWPHLYFIIPVTIAGIILAFAIVKPMDVLLLGESHASVMGVNVKRTRLIMIISASMLAGILTAFTGPIGFIGMTVPHITRMLTGKVTHKYLLPGVVLVGALLLLLCDIISQLPGRAETLPINSVTALFGAPVVIFLIIRSRKMKGDF